MPTYDSPPAQDFPQGPPGFSNTQSFNNPQQYGNSDFPPPQVGVVVILQPFSSDIFFDPLVFQPTSSPNL